MTPFSVLTYNIRHAVLDDDENAWEHRRAGVRALLRDLDPDILALQESTGEQHDAVAADLSGYDWVGVTAEPGSGEHNPIGTTDRFRIEDATTEWLSETPAEAGSVGWDAAFARALTRLTVTDSATDRQLTVFNAHFDHRGRTARRESARLIRQRLDDLPPDRSAVVVGDFNCSPDSPPYDILVGDGFARSLRDARTAAATVAGPETTMTTFTELDPSRRLDHVFVTADLAVERYTTHDRTDEAGRYPSDHLPVGVTLAVDG